MSDTGWIIVSIVSAGFVGGFTNAIVTGELVLPGKDAEAKVYRPGWVGNVIVGGVAALVFWGLYGPMAATVVIGAADPTAVHATLRVSELVGAVLSGFGGGRILTAAADKLFAEKERQALTDAKNKLAQTVADVSRI